MDPDQPTEAVTGWATRGRQWLSIRRNQYIAGVGAAALAILIIILATSLGSGSGSSQDVSRSQSGGGASSTTTPATTPQSATDSGSGATVTATDQDGDKATITFDVGSPAPASSSSVSSQIQSNCQGALTGAGLDLSRASVVSVNATVTLTSSQAATIELQMPDDIQSRQPAYFLTQYSNGWQCSEEIAQANISWKTVQPQGSVQQQIYYVIPDAITPNNPGGQGQNILVDPALLLASQPAGLQGSGPRWATCESGFGGSAPPQLIVAGQDTLSNCTTSGGGSGGSSGSTTQTTVPGNGSFANVTMYLFLRPGDTQTLGSVSSLWGFNLIGVSYTESQDAPTTIACKPGFEAAAQHTSQSIVPYPSNLPPAAQAADCVLDPP